MIAFALSLALAPAQAPPSTKELAVWMDSASCGDPGRSYCVRIPLKP